MGMLVKCGFVFFCAINDYETVMENKFTGLRIVYDERTRSHRVLEES